MKKRIFLVKGESGPEGQDTWIQMEGREFYEFLHTEEGKGRCFIHLVDDIGYEGDIYIEASQDEYQAWQKEYHRHVYLREWRRKKQILSLDGSAWEEEAALADVVADTSMDPEEIVEKKIERERLRDAFARLLKEEQEIIQALYLADRPVTLTALAGQMGIPVSSLCRRKEQILKKMREWIQGGFSEKRKFQ